MNKITRYSLLLAALLATQFKASARYGRNDYTCPKLYIGLSTGIENPSGLIGPNIDVALTQNFSLGAGIGLSTWGYKAYGEGRFYFGECNRGWAIGIGATYNTGITNFATTMPTTLGDQTVSMDLNPRTNVFIAGYRFWNMGHSGHRIYLALGYSIRLNEDNYRVLDPYTKLTSDGESAMRILAPGGPMIGFGFSWGVLR